MNKRVIVTGCSEGIGRATIELLHSLGYQVTGLTRDTKRLSDLSHSGIELLEVDLRSTASIRRVTDHLEKTSRGDYLAVVNNAGFIQYGALEDLDKESLIRQFEINTFAPHELVKNLVPLLRKCTDGRIVQISSMLSYVNLPYYGAYAASKRALEALTDNMRIELHNTPISFSIIQPGSIATSINKHAVQTFIEEIDITTSHHYEEYRSFINRAIHSTKELFQIEPIDVANVVLRALDATHPRTRYKVTLPAQIMWRLRTLLSDHQLDRVIRMAKK